MHQEGSDPARCAYVRARASPRPSSHAAIAPIVAPSAAPDEDVARVVHAQVDAREPDAGGQPSSAHRARGTTAARTTAPANAVIAWPLGIDGSVGTGIERMHVWVSHRRPGAADGAT